MVVRDVLDNGLRILTESIPHVRSVSIGVWLARGSRHEGDTHPGIAHFVEHMLFKGTEARSAEEIAQTVDSVGGQLDASTGKENASYAIKVLDEHLPLAVDILADILLRPRLAAEDVEREKNVVVEEIKMVEDTPDDLVHELFIQRYWAGHPLGRPILGTRESVEGLNPDVLRTYFREAYTASNLIVGAAGHLEHAQLRDLLERSFGGIERGVPVAAGEPPAGVPSVLARSKDLEQSHICLGSTGYRQNHADRYTSLVLNTLLGGSMSSRLFQNVREKRGLAYSVGSGLSSFSDTGLLSIYAGCANERVGEVVEVILGELRSMVDMPVTATELRRAKDNVKGGLLLGLESTWHRASFLARQELYFDRQFSIDDTIAGINAVSVDDVGRVARDLLTRTPLSAVVLGQLNGWTIAQDALRVVA
ncbi:MAG: pitrilysin family protein [Acidobacteriota bacterium]